MVPKLSRSCAITQIKNDVEENKSLTKILDSFFPQQTFERPEKAVKFITTVFVHWFMVLLPEKGKSYILIFLNEKRPNESFIIEWIEVIYGHKPNSKLHNLLQNTPFFHTFDDLKINNATIDLTKFYLKLRANFRFCFLETKIMQGIFEVYRCLLYCKTKTKRPKLFCQAVKNLWKKLNFKDDILTLEPDDSLAEDIHAYLFKIVEKLGDENNEKIKDKIKELFKHDNTSFTIDNQKLIISSYKIVLSNIWEELINKITNNDFEITCIEIVANEIILDQDFVLPGKNLILITTNLAIPFPVVINLSGKDAIDSFGLISAESGKVPGENGKDGKDGAAGGSAGNCTILTEKITDPNNLEVILNGGNGSKGQDGGDGANGEDGKGADFTLIKKQKVKIVLKNVANILTGGSFSRAMDTEFETIANDGSVIFSNDSANYFSTHSYRLYTGSEGKAGGKGGKNGLGGKGGESGNFSLTLKNCSTKDTVKVESIQGCDGPNGNIGENGLPGLKGWDIAITGKTLEKGKIYGETKKEKLKIEYFKIEDEDTVYVNNRNNAENDFKCYAKIKSEPLQRTKLINHEKTAEKGENERKNESIAQKVNQIDEEAAKEKYQELTQSVLNEMLQTEQETEAEYEESTEINRLYEIYNFEFEEEYQPKKKLDPKTITSEEIERIQKNKEGWEILWKYPSPSCFSFEKKLRNKAPNDEIKFKLIKKSLIDDLRDANNDDDDENLSKTRMELMEKFKEDYDENCQVNQLKDSNNFITSDEEPINTKFHKLLAFIIKDDGKYLCKKLTLLYLINNKIGLTLVNTLLLIFENEGMHIDLTTINFLLETIFYFTTSTNNEFLFPSILLTTKQSDWIDELFMLIVEHTFALTPKIKKWLKEFLKTFTDENIKILFCEKLLKSGPENAILKEQLYFIFDPIKNSTTIYPELENSPLKKWLEIIEKHSFQHASENCNIVFQDPETKKLTMFCYDKMVEKFDQVTVRPLFELIAKLVASLDKEIIGRFIQRLCSNEIISGTVTDKNLEEILQYCLNIQNISIDSADNESYKTAKELLCATEKELRKTEDLHKLCQKLNKSNQLSTIITALKQPFEWIIQEEIETCHKKLQNKDFSYDFSLPKFEAFLSEVYGDTNDAEMKHCLFLLEIIDKVIKDQCGFCLRDTQKLAILCALNNKDDKNRMKSVLQQISTGEGKTLIIAALSIILVLKSSKKLKVNIVTSSPVLAKREIESSNGCVALYEAFGLKVGHICHDSQKRRTDIYTKCDIIYGDLTAYQSDYLQHNFLSKNILGDRKNDVVIVDEVDSMLLDNGLNMLYLSHEIAELELLQPIFSKIWQLVNLRFKGEFGDCKNDEFYQIINSTFFPSFLWHEFPGDLDENVDDAELLKKQLIAKRIVDENGRILVTNKKHLKHKLWNIDLQKTDDPNFNEKIKNRFICLYNAMMKERHISVPCNLHNYVCNHLKDFIESAEAAFEMKEGINYQIETISNLHSQTLESRIVIIDSDTGVDLPTTQWTKGLHQFLQLKHGLRLTPISTKAVYISNVSYLKKYDCIFGFSGTLGAEAEKEELIEFYDLKCITLPSSFPKQFYEEPAILVNNEESYFMEIFNSLNNLMKNGRSALVIADSIKLVTILNQKIKRIAKQQLDDRLLHPFFKPIVYKRDHEILKYADGTELLPPKTIIFSTNLAGRGTDIKISKELEANGGLHVIVAFLPPNIRIEEQAFGRAARCGEPGTAQMIVYEKNEKSFLELKTKRNKRENERIQKIKEYYHSKIEPEEHCFLNFSEKLKILKRQIQQKNLSNECYEILCKDIIDQYALELDASMFGQNWIQKIEEFCDNLETKYPTNGTTTLLPIQPSNILRYAVKIAYDKKIEEANIIFDKLSYYFPEYSPESKYFSAIYNIKKRENPALLDSLESILNEAKNGFIEKLKLYAANIAITDPYRVSDDEGIFYNDDFQLQQQMCEHLNLTIIESIDEFLGQLIEPMDFICDSLKEEASMLVYENLSNYENPPIILGYKVCNDFDLEKLEAYCHENGVNFDVAKRDLKRGQIINEKHLRGLFEIQSHQDFWQALKAAYLLDNIRTESFIDITKLSLMSEEILRGCIIGEYEFNQNQLLQYPAVKEWKRISNTRDIHDLKRCFEDNNIIKTTEFGNLSYKNRDFEATLLLSPWITKTDICAYGIFEGNAQKLLSLMAANEIFVKHPSEEAYKLSPKFSWEKCQIFPKWCKQILIKMIKKKFAYVFAYQHFINSDLQGNNNTLLFDETDKTFIAELMELGILESNNVNLDALKKTIPGGNIFDKGCGFLLDNNPAQHYYKALSATHSTIKKTFTKPQHHKSIVSRTSKEQIENVLREKASAKQKYENLDIQFVPIQDALNDMNIDGIRVRPVTHSLPYLISPCEMKWSKKTLVTLGVVGSGAAVQLAAGVSLVIVTFGLGAFAGKFLITEGLSDAIFCAKTAWKGKSDNFLRYKTASMALNVALCGITEPLKYVKVVPSVLNPDAVNVIRRADVFISSGGSLLKTLIPSFTKMEKCETTKTFISKAIEFTIQEISARLLFILEETFQKTEKLKIEMFQLCQKIRIQNSSKFIEDQSDAILRDAEPIIISMFSFIVSEVNKKCIKNSTINLVNYSVIIGGIMQSQKIEQFLNQIKQSLNNQISNITVMLQQQQIEECAFEMGIEESEAEILLNCSKTIESWKLLIEKRFERLIEIKISRPLNELNKMDCQNQLRDIVDAASPQPNAIHQRKNSLNLTNHEKFVQKIKTEYYIQLENLLETTIDSKAFARLTLTTARNHQIVVTSLARLLSTHLHQPITVFIKYKNTNFVGIANSPENADGTSRKISLEQPHEDDNSVANLYEQILQKIPALDFPDFSSFRNALANVIEADDEFQQR